MNKVASHREVNLLIILLILSFQQLCAQKDNDADMQLLYTYIYSKEPDKIKKIINTRFLNFPDATRNILGYTYLVDYYILTHNEKEIPKVLDHAGKLAFRTQKELDIAYVNFGIAKYYFSLNNDHTFINSVNKSINILSKYPDQNMILSHLYFLKHRYHTNNNTLENDIRSDYIQARYYALKSGNNILINFAHNNMGHYYRKQYEATKNKKYLDSAGTCYKKAFQEAKLIRYSTAKKSAELQYYMNSGAMYAYNFLYDESIKTYEKALQISRNDRNFNNASVLIYNNIGSVFLDKKEYKSAESFFLSAYNLGQKDKRINPASRIHTLDKLSIVYENMNQLKKALSFERASRKLVEKTDQQQLKSNAKALTFFYQIQQKDQQISQLKENNHTFQKQKLLYTGVTILSLTGIICLAHLFYYRQKIILQKTNLLKAEKTEVKLSLLLEQEEKIRLKTEQELLMTKQEQLYKQVLASTLQLDQKNSLINTMKEKIKEKENFNFDRILKEEQLADKDFSTIQNLIQEVHPNFFKRLHEVSKKKLSPQDLRYASYIYLNMDNQQIATALKTDTNTVRTTKYRLKQKIGLDKNTDLSVFIQALEL